ncbi:MarR family winged helix-turn-helix transcriptional regulator [Teichococcus wenyumeiae]|uniref:MarR family winged helix-turn-helix transcriptional regulator n=1 Tax=Teichococcus wenyumeiae TaxID=2478470 RepID=UPI0013146BCB|nr:MarR family winged helix-turn-helix transcriptional regulator [Pseudoroseomonas wenyumeiae]
MKLAFKDDTATMPEEAAGLPPLLAVQLWQNPCWLSFRVNFIAAGFNRHVYSAIELRHGLKRPEVVVIYALRLKDGLTATEISLSSAFPKNTISRAIQVLLRRKLVRRATDSQDRRSFVLRLTAAGRSIVDEAIPPMVEREQAMLAALSPAEQHMLHALLTKIVVASPQWNEACENEEAS